MFIHPELNPNEIFLFNCESTLFQLLPFKSKRQGLVPYSGIGNKIEAQNFHPVFILETELHENPMSLVEIRRHYLPIYR